MLLNLSNHPSVKWQKNQYETAIKQYGSVEDMPFPQIPPEENTEGVKELAKQYAATITHKQLTTDNITVHLMGEMTFVVALVGLLQKAGIEVVCSTTQRLVLEEKDGKKTMQFVFVRFRGYGLLN
jgi:hypothetical protein